MTSGYKSWPKDLPLLIVHGTGDRVTDCSASEEFISKVKAGGTKDAEFKSFDGFFHEMHNEASPRHPVCKYSVIFLHADNLCLALLQPGDDKWTEIAALTAWIRSKLPGAPAIPAARL